MRPSTPPAVTTSSPFCSASIIVLCSFARFICGLIIRKYSTPNISDDEDHAFDAAARGAAGGLGVGWIDQHGNAPWTLGLRAQVSEKAGILSRFAASLCAGIPAAKVREPPALDRRAQALHQLLVVVQVVQGIESRAEDFVHALQVMEVGAREIAAGVAARIPGRAARGRRGSARFAA